MFPPHPTAVPEAYLFADKNEFNYKVNAAASQFGFVISNVYGNNYCCSRAAQTSVGQKTLFASKPCGAPIICVIGSSIYQLTNKIL
jgi:hypothetical protein